MLFPQNSPVAQQQEFAIALRSRNRRLNPFRIATTEFSQTTLDFRNGRQLCSLVAHNATFPDLFPPCFKLRLNQHDDLLARAFFPESRSHNGGQH